MIETASTLQTLMDDQGWDSCIIGGLATLYWGEARVTRDVDMTLVTGWGGEEPFVKKWLQHYRSRVETPLSFASENRVVLLTTQSGTPINISWGALPFEQLAVKRAIDVSFGQTKLRICSPEDLLIMKAFANRDRDWNDIAGVLKIRGNSLDRDYVLAQVQVLAEAKPGQRIYQRLKALLP